MAESQWKRSRVASSAPDQTDTDSSITLLTPGVPEPSGNAVDVTVRTSDGKTTLPGAFTYTPTVDVAVIGASLAQLIRNSVTATNGLRWRPIGSIICSVPSMVNNVGEA